MSLEQELARNTAAMIALTAALRQYLDAPVTAAEISRFITSDVPDSDIPVRKIPVVTGAEWAALQEKEVPKPASSAPAVTLATPPAPAVIEYSQVAKAITDVFKVDRAKVVAALAKFGAAKGPQLKAEDYAAFMVELGA